MTFWYDKSEEGPLRNPFVLHNFPAVERDFCFMVDGHIEAQDIINAIDELALSLMEKSK